MAKKKQSPPKTEIENISLFEEGLEVLFEAIEKEIGENEALQRMKEAIPSLSKLPQSVYTYQHPNYQAQARPIASYLHIINQLEWEFDIPKSVINKILAKPKKKLVADLENLIITILAKYHFPDMDDNHLLMSSNLCVALLLLQETRSEESLDSVLEVLRQDMEFIELLFCNNSDTTLSSLVYQLGNRQLPKLLEFMKEPGLFSLNKTQVARAVANIAYTTPSRRLEVISWFCQLLNFYQEHLQDKAISDSFLIDSISALLIGIQGVEALRLLEKIYDSTSIIPLLAPNIDGIRTKISAEAPLIGIGEPANIYDALKELEEYYYAEDALELDEEESSRNTLAKRFTLSITLQNTSPAIWRRVQVPSTLTLPQLHTVIQIAMGWENYHLHQFIKGKIYYLSASEIEESSMFGFTKEVDYTHITLDKMLARKGSKIQYEYDFGDSWVHDIKLEEHQPYLKNEKPVITLLDGANACPPEDCGGCWGFEELLNAMKHPRSKAYREQIEWLGKPFNPTAFDKERVRRILLSFKC